MNERPSPPEQPEHVQRFHFGPWIFNIDRALAIIADSPRPATELPVDQWAQHYGLDAKDQHRLPLIGTTGLDTGYAMSTNLDKPLLIATMPSSDDQTYGLLIDGIHRLYKARVQQVTVLPAFILTESETYGVREDHLPPWPSWSPP